jgi:hypothetical protein
LPDLVAEVVDAAPRQPPVVFTNPGAIPDAAQPAPVATIPPLQTASPDVSCNEPTDDPALTIVHGVRDAERLYFCAASATGEFDPGAKPEPSAGLAYGERWVRGAQAIDFSAALSIWVIASAGPLEGELSCAEALALADGSDLGRDAGGSEATAANLDGGLGAQRDAAGLTVRDAMASITHDLRYSDAAMDAGASRDASRPDASSALQVGPTSLRVLPFVSFPADSFEQAASSLLIATGCVGPVAEAAAAACGVRHTAPSALAPVWVPLSRVLDFGTMGLQFVNASTLERATLRSSPSEGSDAAYFTVASSVGAGDIAPRESRTGVGIADLGTDLGAVAVRIESGTGSEPLLSQSWAETLQFSGDLELANARSFSFVLLGSLGTTGMGFVMQPPRVILIPNDPLPNQ